MPFVLKKVFICVRKSCRNDMKGTEQVVGKEIIDALNYIILDV